jgi:hypothetical protein
MTPIALLTGINVLLFHVMENDQWLYDDMQTIILSLIRFNSYMGAAPNCWKLTYNVDRHYDVY